MTSIACHTERSEESDCTATCQFIPNEMRNLIPIRNQMLRFAQHDIGYFTQHYNRFAKHDNHFFLCQNLIMSDRKISSALISVYHKEGLEPIVRILRQLGVRIISTGGTETFLKGLNIPVEAVESLTGFPEILGGRVKTLHPVIFGGILSRRDQLGDQEQIALHHIPQIDLVIVDLYPFEETVRGQKEGGTTGGNESAIIEKIDIGGIALIRAAAKNFDDVLVCASREEYSEIEKLLQEKQGITSVADRRLYAAKAFSITSHYDAAIFKYFNQDEKLDVFSENFIKGKPLRYGENPHQKGIFYGDPDELFEKISGKEISYNNLVDTDAAIRLIHEFTHPACAVIKHTNPCGCAEAEEAASAWERALAADPVSAFGGIIIFNCELDKVAAEKVNAIFFEIIIAPSYTADAIRILQHKKNRIILRSKSGISDVGTDAEAKGSENIRTFRSLLNGVIEQEADTALSSASTWKVVTDAQPLPLQADDLLFAEKCVKHLKSNAIVLAYNRQLIGMGCGQTSRVDALKQAIAKAKSFGFDLNNAVMASDAFFPFSDCVEIAAKEGIAAVIQPGGSVRDQDSIDACNKFGMVMVTTGLRHFLH